MDEMCGYECASGDDVVGEIVAAEEMSVVPQVRQVRSKQAGANQAVHNSMGERYVTWSKRLRSDPIELSRTSSTRHRWPCIPALSNREMVRSLYILFDSSLRRLVSPNHLHMSFDHLD